MCAKQVGSQAKYAVVKDVLYIRETSREGQALPEFSDEISVAQGSTGHSIGLAAKSGALFPVVKDNPHPRTFRIAFAYFSG